MSLFGNPMLAGSAGQGPSADLGDTIDQSLRFSGSQYLTGPTGTSTSTYTFSAWVKKAFLQTNRTSGYILGLNTNGNGFGFYTDQLSSSLPSYYSAARFRDPSSWYHVVANTTGQYWINGEAVSDSPSSLINPSNDAFVIGTLYPAQASSYGWVGQIAQVYLVDNQELDADHFGKYNEDGVWVPQDYTGTYGTNGFHLTFDSSGKAGQTGDGAGIGADHSPNNNHFTPTGFDTGDVGLYSPALTTTSTFESGRPATAAFDGSTSTYARSKFVGEELTFQPSNGIAFTNTLRVWGGPSAGQLLSYNDGSDISLNANNWTNVVTSGGGTLNKLIVDGNTTDAALSAVEVDGTILVDNTDNDVDYFDTPTSNYATFNPLHQRLTSLNHANLGIGTSSSWNHTSGTIVVPETGKYYYEYVATSASNGRVGFMNIDRNQQDGAITGITGYWWVGGGGEVYDNGSQQTSVTSWTNGDVIGIRFDRDNDEVKAYRNNTLIHTWDISSVTERLAPMVSGANTPDNTINFGQMPFIYTPPDGFSALQTNNLPEPTIKNGKEHFDVVTFTNSTSGNTITGLNFQPDLVWIKVRNQPYSHRLADSVRGVQNYLISNANNAEQTNQSDSLLSFTSDGFTTGAQGQANGDTNVAWCWKAGGTAVSNSDGTEASTVSANTDAGFSIVQWTPDGAAGTVGHGLDAAPECIFLKGLDSSAWYVYHASAGATHYASLSATIEFFPSSAVWNNTAPTSSVFSVGSVGNANRGGAAAIAYCWHSVEGFSKFGSFEGNNNNGDGPFVYLGFRPSYLLCKAADIDTENWIILDSTRSTSNVTADYLMANKNQTDRDGSTFVIGVDFLSNGFKCRGNNNINTGTGTYVYMAFAENPFGGENAPPATAR